MAEEHSRRKLFALRARQFFHRSPSPQPLPAPSPSPIARRDDEAPSPVPAPALLPPPTRDLWKEALAKSSPKAQKWMKLNGYGGLNPGSFSQQMGELVRLAREKESGVDDKKWKIQIGSQTIIPRDYVADSVRLLSMIGDAAITFAPPQASAPWSALKAVMQIPVMGAEQICAVLGIVDKITRIIRRGQVYELVYTAEAVGDSVETSLQDALLDLYAASIELLAESDTLFSQGTAKQTIHAVIHPKQAEGLVADLFELEERLSLEVQACESTRSTRSDARIDERLEKLKDTLQGLDLPLTRVDARVGRLLERVEDTKRDEILDFISCELFGQRHYMTRESRTPGTGEWLLQHESFREWEGIPSSSTFLWLEGTVGTGKTFLTSTVIDHVEDALNSSPHNEGFAFFYCRRTGPSGVDPLIVLRSYVRQLSSVANSFEDIEVKLMQRCAEAKRKGMDLSYEVCKELILESINLYPKTTIILDALDECDRSSHSLAETFVQIMEKAAKPIKLFVSSRKDRDIAKAFRSMPTIAINAKNNEGDIENFLNENLYSRAWYTETCQEELKPQIKEMFSSRSQGMFRWVDMQVRALEGCFTEGAIIKRLKMLPKDLTEAYDQLYAEIETRDANDIALAERAFKWIMCSCHELEVDTLLEAIRLIPQGNTIKTTAKQTQENLLALCQDFLTVNHQRNVFEFPHLSVAEYFESKHWSMKEADCLVGHVSLALLFETYSAIDPMIRLTLYLDNSDDTNPDPPIPEQPLEGYARHHWLTHVRRYDEVIRPGDEINTDLSLVLKRFLGLPGESSMQYQRWLRFTNTSSYKVIPGRCPWPETSALHPLRRYGTLNPEPISLFSMCRFALYHLLQDWWDSDPTITTLAATTWTDDGVNALALAAMAGSRDICTRLLPHVNINAPLKHRVYGSVLIAAIGEGQASIVRFLVKEAGADVNMRFDSHFDFAIVAAPRSLSVELLVWLIEEGGADINLSVGSGDVLSARVLAEAAFCGNKDMVEYLVVHAKADVNAVFRTDAYPSPLVAALMSFESDVEVTRFLISHGAEVNALLRTGAFGSALAAAACRGRLAEVKMLIEAGADVNLLVQAGQYGSALAAAAAEAGVAEMEALIEAGADVNLMLQAGRYGSALAAACQSLSGDTVEYLIRKGAEVDLVLESGHYGSALVAAICPAFRCNDIATSTLLQMGASPALHLKTGHHGSALAAAAFWWKEHLLQRMIDSTPREQVLEALRHSWHPPKDSKSYINCARYVDEAEVRMARKRCARLLVEEVGLEPEILVQIGLKMPDDNPI